MCAHVVWCVWVVCAQRRLWAARGLVAIGHRRVRLFCGQGGALGRPGRAKFAPEVEKNRRENGGGGAEDDG